jgi:CubicO group peptidase (beta-lactamase class C family)
MKKLLVLLLLITGFETKAQTYFPPLIGDTWDTIAPVSLGWCEDSILVMYDYLEQTDSKAFIVLKDGKIVLEKYFGTFTKDSLWLWNSAGKTLTAYAVGIAQTEGFLDINDVSSDYLGLGWTNLTAPQESAVKIIHQLSMTTGFDDGVPDFFCTDPVCLQYLADPGTRWAYHNGPYTMLDEVITNATSMTLNQWVNQKIKTKIGMSGSFFPIGYNRIFISNARSMARFGLLLSQDGMWDATTVQSDLTYLNAMRTPSQTINPSYGYLTWLNGQTSFMLPGVQFSFTGSPMPNAPADIYAALGKDGQIINVAPSDGLVLIRMGSSMGTSLVGNQYNDTIWQYMNRLNCPASIQEHDLLSLNVSPNPSNGIFTINGLIEDDKIEIFNSIGQAVSFKENSGSFELSNSIKGIYFVNIERMGIKRVLKLIVE